MTAVYRRAGMTDAETEHLSELIAAVEAADPTRPAVAVDRADVLAVVAVLDRLITAGLVPYVPAVSVADEPDWLRAAGLRVRLARVARRESQARLSERSGVSRVTLGSVERGDHPAAVTTYARLALALGVPLAELLGDPA